MKRMMSRKSYSWWWDSHVSPKNSKWLSENLEQMDCLVKEMLKLIEEDGDSFAKKAEMYYRRRPELITHVEDFYRMYRALAERYDNVTGELRKTIPSELQSQGSGSGSDFGAEQVSPSPEHTPERKLNLPLPNKRAAGFDIFLGSDFSGKGSGYSSSSSSSSESGSDSEDANGKVINANDNSKGLNERIIQLENELHELRVKLQEYEIGSSGHCGHLVSTENLDIPNALASNTESEASNEMHPESEGRIVALEAELSNHKSEIRSLNEAMVTSAKQFEAEISNKNHTIEEYKTQLDESLKKFMQEKLTIEAELSNHKSEIWCPNEAMVATAKQFEAEISNKNHTIEEYKTQLDEALKKFMQEKLTVEAELSNHKSEIRSLNEAMVATAKQFEAEISKKNHTIEEYKTQLDEALKKFMQEKLTVEAELKNSIDNLKAEAEQLSKEKSLIEIRISDQEQVIKELRVMLTESSERFHHDKAELEGKVCSLLNSENNYAAKLQALEDKLSELEAEKTEACNESDGYKLRVDMLMAEKDELNARIGKLVNDAKSRDDSYHSIAEHLHQLHLEHVKLIKEFEDSKKAYVELINRVRELEEEVIKQRVLISDGAEGKREAIRQLCFSLEHYRDGYKQLRQVLLVQNRRHTIMAT